MLTAKAEILPEPELAIKAKLAVGAGADAMVELRIPPLHPITSNSASISAPSDDKIHTCHCVTLRIPKRCAPGIILQNLTFLFSSLSVRKLVKAYSKLPTLDNGLVSVRLATVRPHYTGVGSHALCVAFCHRR